jgi:hypothetical protein
MEVIFVLPDSWTAPSTTLAPLLEREDPQWLTIVTYVRNQLRESGNSENTILSYTREAMSRDFRHLVQASMVYMGEIELEHESPILQ